MNSKTKSKVIYIVLALVFVVLIAVSVISYNFLSEKFSSENTEQSQEHSENNTVSAPEFTVLDAQGSQVKLSDFTGKPVIINF